MTYIVNYTPETDDVFVYNQPFAVWPIRQFQLAIRENENLPLKNQTVVYNGQTITYDIDLSGIENPYRSIAYFFCSDCFQVQPNWPHCSGMWEYCMGASGLVSIGACNPAAFNTQNEPVKTINPAIVDSNGFPINAQYWNDPNLWHTNTFRMNILVESESDDETYLFALGHPITTSPCDYDFGFYFFDRETNKIEYRLFTCPCREWQLPLTGQYCSSGDCVHYCNNCCAPPYSMFTSGNETDGTRDSGRLFVMKKGQEPLPKSIKRYKILTGPVRKNDWPIFGIDSSYRFIKARTNTDTSTSKFVYRTREDGNFRFGNISKNYLNDVQINWDSGEGDDGPYPSFTISAEGETIFVAVNSSFGYGDYISVIDDQTYNQPLTQNVPNPCVEGNIFYKQDGKLKFNTYCLPAFFHPELVIPNYPETDIKIYTDTAARGDISQRTINRWNYYLEQLGKPKIVSYQFPEFVVPNETYFPDTISETDKKYPLVNSPYFSRESKNSFFPNTNLIDFREKKMLQASELNELQEKFYRKQSSFIMHYNKWLSKINLTKQNKDILGFSEKIDLNSITSSVPSNTLVRYSKAIPTENNILILGSRNENQVAEIKLKPCTLMIHTNFGYLSDGDDSDGDDLAASTFDRTYYQNIDFIKINSDTVGVVDLSKITETNIHCITLTLDINNIITCNEYNELRDNSSPDGNSSSPCGANRNYISPVNTSTIIQQDIDINSEQFINMVKYNAIALTFSNITPFNTFAVNGLVRYLLGYMKKENGQINFYYANGVKIENI